MPAPEVTKNGKKTLQTETKQKRLLKGAGGGRGGKEGKRRGGERKGRQGGGERRGRGRKIREQAQLRA